jgi:hypothetical protein
VGAGARASSSSSGENPSSTRATSIDISVEKRTILQYCAFTLPALLSIFLSDKEMDYDATIHEN